jgi:probable O-glycosylation ligase (exosortase A-associated)
MGIIVAILTAVILGLIILKNPYIGLIVVVVSEYIRIGTLLPDFGLIRFQALMIGLLLLVFLKELLLTRNIKIPSFPQNKAQFGFLIVMGINVIFAFVKTPAAKIFYGQVAILIIFFMIISLLNTQEKLKKFVVFFILANVFLALLGLYSYSFVNTDIDNLSTGGFVGGQDDFAVVIIAAIPFAFFLYQQQKLNKSKIFYALLTILLVAAVILAFSRGGWVALIGISVLIIIFSTHKIRTAILMLIVVIIVLNILPHEFAEEFNTITPETGTAQHRFELWKAAWQMYLDHPIIGVGMNNFPGLYGRFYMLDNPHSYRWTTAHSIYFQLIAELGSLGAIFFIFIVYWIIKDNLIINNKLNAASQIFPFPTALSKALLVSIAGYLIGGAFLSTLYYPPLYIIAALTVALRNIVEKEILKEDSLKSNQLLTPALETQDISFSNI